MVNVLSRAGNKNYEPNNSYRSKVDGKKREGTVRSAKYVIGCPFQFYTLHYMSGMIGSEGEG